MVSVNTVINAQLAQQANDKAARSIARHSQALSLGQRIASAADDAAGLSIASKFTAQINGLLQAVRNAGDAISLSQTAEAGIDGITQHLQRARELAVAMGNDTLSAQERAVVQREIEQAMVGVAGLVAATQFNTQPLLSADQADQANWQDHAINQTLAGQVASKQTAMPSAASTSAQHATVYELEQGTSSHVVTPTTSVQTYSPTVSLDTTAAELGPRWRSDGDTLLFASERSGTEAVYQLPATGGEASVDDGAQPALSQRFTAGDGAFRLTGGAGALSLEFKNQQGAWSTLANYELFPREAAGLANFSFAPTDGDTALQFVYTDVYGNLQSVSVERDTRQVAEPTLLISSDDTLALQQQVIDLGAPPNLLYMNTADQTFKIEKVNDSGATSLTYWDGTGSAPSGGYYTVSGSQVSFFDEARIGAQPEDDGQDHYRITQSTDATPGTDFFSVPVPGGAELYNMDGSAGPRSLKITIGDTVVDRSQLLATRPAEGENPDAIYVNPATQTIEIYGRLRPRVDEAVTVTHLTGDLDGQNASHQALVTSGEASGSAPSSAWATLIDTYNLVDGGDLSAERALRVFVGGTEVPYDSSAQSGFSFDRSSGRVTLSGDYRPDPHDDTPLRFEFVVDHTGSETSADVAGIVLSHWPEVYNLDDDTGEPKSMRVYKNGTALAHDGSNGYLYNATTNNIELYGSARPDATDTYSVVYIETLNASTQSDGMVRYALRDDIAGFVYSASDADAPQTFDVRVNGEAVAYDPSGSNGYRYNPDTHEIELFGSARPDAQTPVDVVMRVNSLVPQTSTEAENATYDVPVSGVEAYGLSPMATPASIQVTLNGEAVPYDSVNGFSFDPDTQQVSLHGSARPTASDVNALSVRWVPQSAYQQSIPSGHVVARVLLDGQPVPLASANDGSGYVLDGGVVRLVGTARPDASAATAELRVEHFADPNPYSLLSATAAMPQEILRILPHMSGEVDRESIQVTVNGQAVAAEAYSLVLPNLNLDWDQIDIDSLPLNVQIDYRAAVIDRVAPLNFQFQIGANAQQSLGLQIEAFENLLFGVYRDPAPSADHAGTWISRMDQAIQFSSAQQANLGSFQNRLVYAADALLTTAAQVTQARSRIEDADYARATTELTKAQILAQGSQAVLAQATDDLNRVLDLLATSRL